MPGIEKHTTPLDRRKLEALFHAHFPGLVAFARKYVFDEDTAREVVHGVFVNLWERRAEIDASKPMKSYLFTSVHHRCLNEIRNRRKTDTQTDVEGNYFDDGGEFEDHLETIELEERIAKAIAALAPQSRRVFKLNRFEGLTYREISTKLNISQKTVETLMSRTLKTLREKLKDYLITIAWFLIIYLVTIK
ncbi:MAG: RNA polymerase sigma-70 factor [Chlorobi bacterium]|nr:RNA polymerase sigma-70 factor [Chlorobiota bacterium]